MLDQHDPHEVARALLDPTHPTGDPVIAAIQLLMTGFGYNFYDARNVARANDQLVRAKASGLLADAGRVLARLEFSYREEHIPELTREQPSLPPDVLQPLKKLERTIRRLADVDTRIRSLETPASDFVWFRIRDERSMLEKLLALDVGLVVTATDVAQRVDALNVEALLDSGLAEITADLDRLDTALSQRRALLTIPA